MIGNFMETLSAVLEIPLHCDKSVPAVVGTHKQQVWQKQSFYVAIGSACQRILVQCFPIWSLELCPDLESS